MQILHKISIDMAKKSVPPVVYGMQNDTNSRAVEVSLFLDSVPWSVPSGSSVSVAFKNKTDGHKGWYDKLPDGSDACTVNGNVVTAVLAPAVLSGAGEVNAAIVFQDENLNQLATFGFCIVVEPNPAAGASVSNDYYKYSTIEQINKAIDRVEQEAGSAIVCDESGSVISVSDSSDRALQGLTIYGKTTQNGTPSTSNPVPLEGLTDGTSFVMTVAGKNLLNVSADNTAIHQDYPNWRVEDQRVIISAWTIVGFKMPVVYGVQYMTSIHKSVNASNPFNYRIYEYSGEPSLMSSKDPYYVRSVFDIGVQAQSKYEIAYTPSSADVKWIAVGCYAEGANEIYGMQVEVGTTATEYERYKAQPVSVSDNNFFHGIPVASGGNYTDASGQQWIANYRDYARGVDVQTVGVEIFDGDEGWYTGSTKSAYRMLSGKIASLINISKPILCSQFTKVSSDATWAETTGISINTSGVLECYTPSFNTSSATPWCNHLAQNPMVVMYVLKAPVEIPIPAVDRVDFSGLHTNKPNTTIFNDVGVHMDVSYVADTKAYIDNKFTELAAAIVSNA